MSHKKAAKLMGRHNGRIARVCAKNVRRLVPRYKDVDTTALERNIGGLISGLEFLIESGDDTKLLEFVDGIVELRSTAGFQMNEILTAGLALLPVLRRFYLQACTDPLVGLAYYDEAEARALPVIVALVEAISESERAKELNEDSPDMFRDFFLSAMSEDPSPFPPLALFEDDEGEDTVRESRP